MKRTTLDILCCPDCHTALALREERGNGVVVEDGSLHCPRCEKDFPLVEGIPRFIRSEELRGPNRRFARFYDWFSHVYVPFSRIGFAFLGGEEHCRREILDRLDPTGGRVLEVSIGPGVNLPYLMDTPGAGEVYGLDISQGQLQRCRSYSHRQGWTVDLFLGTAEALPFQDASFGCVFHIGGINFFSDRQQAIEEMIRVARPGTKIVIADETERGARAYNWVFPTFSRMFEGQRESVRAPIDLVPPDMEAIHLDTIWRGLGYCLEFRKPTLPAERAAA